MVTLIVNIQVKIVMLMTLVTFWVTSACANDHKNYFTQYKNKKALMQPFDGMSHEEEEFFILGKSFFRVPWVHAPAITTARDGVGPLFSASTCKNCHPNNGAGVAIAKHGKPSRSLLLRLGHKHTLKSDINTTGFTPDSTYGAQLSIHGSVKTKFEGTLKVVYEEILGEYPDGTKYVLRKPTYSAENLHYGSLDKETIIAPRIGSALIGLGFIEQIREEDILANEDIDDKNKDGISGKANYVYNPETNRTELGRFTWKASASTVKHQSAAAAHNDMGLSNPLFPSDNCTQKQKECLEEAELGKGKHRFDLNGARLDAITYYLTHLKVPVRKKSKEAKEGERIFEKVGCISCHTSSFTTSTGIKIKPYSDFLLHDMGEGLADGRSEFLANRLEWRTAPLWGKGLQKRVSGEANFLHDGRARSVEEAILWHGGEAEVSKNTYMSLDKKSREKLLQFIESI
jgi:CxxC motif-containing protein (DUF1111 family)